MQGEGRSSRVAELYLQNSSCGNNKVSKIYRGRHLACHQPLENVDLGPPHQAYRDHYLVVNVNLNQSCDFLEDFGSLKFPVPNVLTPIAVFSSSKLNEANTNAHRRDLCGGIYQTEFHLMVNYLQYLQLAKALAESQLRIEGTDFLDNEKVISYSV
jgi:hypothetical protein